jgi:transcriptional regulator with XRE-family HTH domain
MELSLIPGHDHTERGQRIRELRLRLGLTSAEVAAACGFHAHSRIASYENGHTPFSAAMERRITDAILELAATKDGAR